MIEELIRNREGYLEGKHIRECVECGILFARRNNKKATTCLPCDRKRRRRISPKEHIYRSIKYKAKERGFEFDLDIDDFDLPERCPVFGFEFDYSERGIISGRLEGPSVDRIDNTKGYVKGNIQIISLLANQMKNSATIEQLQKFSEWVNKAFPLSYNQTKTLDNS